MSCEQELCLHWSGDGNDVPSLVSRPDRDMEELGPECWCTDADMENGTPESYCPAHGDDQ